MLRVGIRWYDRQVGSSQYGLGGRAARKWGPDSLEGVLTEEELAANRADQGLDTATYMFRDDEYYASKDFDLADIEIPVLSVANWVCSLLSLYLLFHKSNSTTLGRHSSSPTWKRSWISRRFLPTQVPQIHHWSARYPILLRARGRHPEVFPGRFSERSRYSWLVGARKSSPY